MLNEADSHPEQKSETKIGISHLSLENLRSMPIDLLKNMHDGKATTIAGLRGKEALTPIEKDDLAGHVADQDIIDKVLLERSRELEAFVEKQ